MKREIERRETGDGEGNGQGDGGYIWVGEEREIQRNRKIA